MIVLPLVALPLLLAGLLIATRPPRPVRRAVLLVTLSATLATATVLLWRVRDGAIVVHHLGGWPEPLGIAFAVDTFSALMLTVTGLLTLVVCMFAVVTGDADEPFFCPLVLVLTAGVNGALMTADLFDLFVFIEIMLLPSYGLILLAHRGQGRRAQVTAGRVYVTVNLLTSTLFLVGIALVYAGAGTVALSGLAGAGHRSPSATLGALIILTALGIKGAVFPAHGWLGRTYPHLSPAVTALFSGLHTKVAVYAIFRLYLLLFGHNRFAPVATAVFAVSMAVGVFAALGEADARAILSLHMVSQIGYVLLGLSLLTTAGIAAGVFYLVHNIIAKGALFLSVGAVEERYGRRPIGQVTGLLWREPLTGVAFLAGALSLAGLPPFSGFVAKLAIITAAFTAGQWAAGTAALLVSLFTLLSMLKIWGGSFLGRPDPPLAAHEGPRVGARLIAPALVLAGFSLALGAGGQALLSVSDVAARGLLDTSAYVQAVSVR
ncbi:MAG: monovalent cation/H+ antiporter subunit D family protein [Dermatophilaceae bacterium]